MTAFGAVFRADLFTRGEKDVGNVSGLEVKIEKSLRESDDNISDPNWAFDYVSCSHCLTSLYLVASIRIMPFLFVLFFYVGEQKSMKVSLVVSNLVSTVLSYR